MKRWFAALIAALLLTSLAACQGNTDSPAETDPSTVTTAESVTEALPETTAETPSDTQAESHPDTATDTTAETPVETPPETAPETEPDDPNRLAVAALSDDVSGSFFSRSIRCSGSLCEDPDAGKVLRLSTKDISAAGTAGPETYLSLSKLASNLGKEVPSVEAYPYLVMKVRAGDVWSRLFAVYGGDKIITAKPQDDTQLACTYLKDTEDWQYIYFDLSAIKGALNTLFFRFEAGAAKNGETVDIAELRFLATEEEATALCGQNVYELEAPNDTLRVISYNIWVGNGTNTTIRGDILREMLDTYKPDSIGMQEVNLAWKSVMESFVFNGSYAGVGEGRSDAYEACLLYYRVDKYELVDSGTFWLSDTPDVKGSSFAEALYPRICTWAHLRDRRTGFEYVHVNTHLDHLGGGKGGNELRGKQAQVLLEFTNRLGDLPMVMTGDFNSNPANSKGTLHPAYAYITGAESFEATDGSTVKGPFADARVHADKTVPADRTATMTKYYEEGGDPTTPPIDYHFYTPSHFHPLSYDTFIFERDGVPLSDHLALICEYRILVENES